MGLGDDYWKVWGDSDFVSALKGSPRKIFPIPLNWPSDGVGEDNPLQKLIDDLEEINEDASEESDLLERDKDIVEMTDDEWSSFVKGDMLEDYDRTKVFTCVICDDEIHREEEGIPYEFNDWFCDGCREMILMDKRRIEEGED